MLSSIPMFKLDWEYCSIVIRITNERKIVSKLDWALDLMYVCSPLSPPSLSLSDSSPKFMGYRISFSGIDSEQLSRMVDYQKKRFQLIVKLSNFDLPSLERLTT